MSILKVEDSIQTLQAGSSDPKVKQQLDDLWKKSPLSKYQPSDEEKAALGLMRRHFRLGDLTMQKPRPEFNDLSVLQRQQVDMLAFNTYQPNNGEPLEGDVINGWKSNAIRPIVRNKCISIAAHATARLIFPRVFAKNRLNEEESDAARVMEDLMEVVAEQSNYAQFSLFRTISALYEPASIGYTEYTEVYRTVKRVQENGSIKEETILDENLSGFQNIVVPVNELYIENFYEPDIQKQGWLVWRRVISYSLAETKYGHLPNFEFVRPGVQLIYNDANQQFYEVYDPNMRPEMVEEVIYFNRSKDLKLTEVNGVLLSNWNNPIPRNDKLYPFDKFGYELINTKCFYYKSLAFKMQQDANIVNTLYPMIIDGTYLSLMPPMINSGGEAITSDVIIPGAVTTFSDPNAKLTPIFPGSNLKAGMDSLFKVEESISQTTESPLQEGNQQPGEQTAYEIQRLEQNASTILGLFIKMISDHVKQFGKLRMGDILQYLTIGEVSDLEKDAGLIYKTFFLPNKRSGSKTTTRKIQFDSSLPTESSEKQNLALSYQTLKLEGGENAKTELFRVNPELYRQISFSCTVSPDVLNPRSEELERAFALEAYDRGINNQFVDQEALTRDLLFGTNPVTMRNPEKFVKKPDQVNTMQLPTDPKQALQQPKAQQPKPLNQSPLIATKV